MATSAAVVGGSLLGAGSTAAGLLLGAGLAALVAMSGRQVLRASPGTSTFCFYSRAALLLVLLAAAATRAAGRTPLAAEALPLSGAWRGSHAWDEGESGRLGRGATLVHLPRGALREGEVARLSTCREAILRARHPWVEADAPRIARLQPALDELERLAAAPPSWRAAVRMPREHALARLEGLEPQGARALVRALLLGERSGIGAATSDLFVRTGTRHLLALSGLHVVLLVAILARPLGELASRAAGKLGALLGLGLRLRPELFQVPLVLAFVPLGGGAAPVARAAVAAAFLLLAPLWPRSRAPGRRVGLRRPAALHLWGLALTLEVAADPGAPGELSVQLSYLASLGLLLCTGRVRAALARALPGAGQVAPVGRWGRPRSHAWRTALTLGVRTGTGLAASSLVAVAATLPIAWLRFGEWSPAGLLATPLALLPMVVLIAGGLAWLLAPGVGTEAIVAGASGALVGLLELVDRLPATPMPLPERPAALLWAAWLAALFAVLLSRRAKGDEAGAMDAVPGPGPGESGPAARRAESAGTSSRAPDGTTPPGRGDSALLRWMDAETSARPGAGQARRFSGAKAPEDPASGRRMELRSRAAAAGEPAGSSTATSASRSGAASLPDPQTPATPASRSGASAPGPSAPPAAMASPCESSPETPASRSAVGSGAGPQARAFPADRSGAGAPRASARAASPWEPARPSWPSWRGRGMPQPSRAAGAGGEGATAARCAGCVRDALARLAERAGDRRIPARCAAALLALALLPWSLAPRGLEVHALEVGHGTAVLVRAPGEPCWIFDAGSTDRPGLAREALAPVLRRWEVARPRVVLTHPHHDHASALPYLVERWRPSGWFGALPAHIAVRLPHDCLHADVGRGRIRLPGVRGDHEWVLARGRVDDTNEGSRILRVESGGRVLLLTGDAEQEGLAGLLDDGALEGPCELLLFPHHGSDTAQLARLLATARPARTWISSAARPGVAGELERRGLDWSWTGTSGCLRFARPPAGNGPGGARPAGGRPRRPPARRGLFRSPDDNRHAPCI